MYICCMHIGRVFFGGVYIVNIIYLINLFTNAMGRFIFWVPAGGFIFSSKTD